MESKQVMDESTLLTSILLFLSLWSVLSLVSVSRTLSLSHSLPLSFTLSLSLSPSPFHSLSLSLDLSGFFSLSLYFLSLSPPLVFSHHPHDYHHHQATMTRKCSWAPEAMSRSATATSPPAATVADVGAALYRRQPSPKYSGGWRGNEGANPASRSNNPLGGRSLVHGIITTPSAGNVTAGYANTTTSTATRGPSSGVVRGHASAVEKSAREAPAAPTSVPLKASACSGCPVTRSRPADSFRLKI
jgi:hypothetical protein